LAKNLLHVGIGPRKFDATTRIASRVSPMKIPGLVALLMTLAATTLWAQVPAAGPASPAAPSLMITIPDEPTAVDPASVMPPALSRKVTKEFSKTSLRDLAQWAKTELQMPVILDAKGLGELGLLSSEQITDQLQDEPISLILDRLDLIGMGWFIEDGTLHLTSRSEANEHYLTVQYVVSDLLDAKYPDHALIRVIEECTSGPWDANEPGTGTIILLGDVLFVRQTDRVHWEVASLLSGLRKHGRRTMLLDHPSHTGLRAKLEQVVNLNLDETPLDEAIRLLGTEAGLTLRIHPSVVNEGVRIRQPVTLKIEDQRLRAAIQEIGTRLGVELRGLVSDGALWVVAESELKSRSSTAVFDVRDLCRDEAEVAALSDAIYSQTRGPWDQDEPGTGVLEFPVPGTMVCRQNPTQLDEVLSLLENYRTALRASKPRAKVDESGKITTHYYRMPAEMADDLLLLIPQMIVPDTWQGAAATGSIRKVASKSELETVNKAAGEPPGKGAPATPAATISSPRSVLIIRQSNAVHTEIQTLIRNIQSGNEPVPEAVQGGQGGLGGGGFGGGFFQIEKPVSTGK
jgi:hypothetical protein